MPVLAQLAHTHRDALVGLLLREPLPDYGALNVFTAKPPDATGLPLVPAVVPVLRAWTAACDIVRGRVRRRLACLGLGSLLLSPDVLAAVSAARVDGGGAVAVRGDGGYGTRASAARGDARRAEPVPLAQVRVRLHAVVVAADARTSTAAACVLQMLSCVCGGGGGHAKLLYTFTAGAGDVPCRGALRDRGRG